MSAHKAKSVGELSSSEVSDWKIFQQIFRFSNLKREHQSCPADIVNDSECLALMLRLDEIY